MQTLERFKTTLDTISARFFLPEEFPLQDRASDAQIVAQRAISESTANLESYASKLTSFDLDNLLFSFALVPDEKVSKLLIIRFTKRMASLLWALFQFHPDRAALPELISNTGLTQNSLHINGGRLMLLEGFTSDPVSVVARQMLSECGSYDAFIDRYGLIRGAPFCRLVTESFYTQCEPLVLASNLESFTKYITQHESPGDSLAVQHYLSSFESWQFHIPLNLYLIERLGIPSATPENWANIPEDISEKIGDWYKTYILSGVLKYSGSKYKIITDRLKSIKEVIYDEDERVLRLDFGSFSIFDPNPKNTIAYLFTDSKVGMSITRDEFSAFNQLPDARDYIIKEIESGVYLLDFVEFGKLYAEDILDTLKSIPQIRGGV